MFLFPVMTSFTGRYRYSTYKQIKLQTRQINAIPDFFQIPCCSTAFSFAFPFDMLYNKLILLIYKQYQLQFTMTIKMGKYQKGITSECYFGELKVTLNSIPLGTFILFYFFYLATLIYF